MWEEEDLSKDYWAHKTKLGIATHFSEIIVTEIIVTVPVTSSSCILYNNYVKDTQGHG